MVLGNMEGGNTNNFKFIIYFMKGLMDELDPRKKLLDLVKFYGAKVVHMSGGLLEVDQPNLTPMFCTFHGGNTCFSEIGNLELLNNLIGGSNLLHRFLGVKFHH